MRHGMHVSLGGILPLELRRVSSFPSRFPLRWYYQGYNATHKEFLLASMTSALGHTSS
jgi:hypothetical protein